MFAGPNGSGKSTIKTVLEESKLGVYINPDEIEGHIRTTGNLDLSTYADGFAASRVIDFFRGSELLKKSGFDRLIPSFHAAGSRLDFRDVPVNSYYASVIADCIRKDLIELKDQNGIRSRLVRHLCHPTLSNW